jgi:hypothetical protein
MPPVSVELLTLEETAHYLRLTPAAIYTQQYRRENPGALGIRLGMRILFRPHHFVGECPPRAEPVRPYSSSEASAELVRLTNTSRPRVIAMKLATAPTKSPYAGSTKESVASASPE